MKSEYDEMKVAIQKEISNLRFRENLKMLVDRTTPKKPVLSILEDYKSYHCPTCGNLVGSGECCNDNSCRQALDWSE